MTHISLSFSTLSVGQAPLTYYRQVLALCDLPADSGVDHPDINKVFPPDVIDRARQLRGAIGAAGTGSYTNSQGILDFRQNVAKFIEQRDGHPAYSGNIFLTNGAVRGSMARTRNKRLRLNRVASHFTMTLWCPFSGSTVQRY